MEAAPPRGSSRPRRERWVPHTPPLSAQRGSQSAGGRRLRAGERRRRAGRGCGTRGTRPACRAERPCAGADVRLGGLAEQRLLCRCGWPPPPPPRLFGCGRTAGIREQQLRCVCRVRLRPRRQRLNQRPKRMC